MAETARPVLASIESDDFISWDPWGDDDVRWPGGYWNDIVQPLLEPREDTEDGDASGDDAVDQSDHIVQIMLEPGEGIEDGGASGEIDFDEFSGSGWDHLSPLWEQMTQDPSLTPECALRTDEQPQTEPNSTTQEVRDEEREPTKLEKACAVCLEDVSRDRFPDLTHAENNSQHTSDVCLDCWDDHLEAEVKSKGFEGVSCPQCSHKLLESEVRKLAKANTYVEYLNEGAKGCMQQDEEFRACPSATCPWGAFFAADDGNIFNCQMCSLRWCLSCDVPFHEQRTCEEHTAAEFTHVSEVQGQDLQI